MCKLSHGPQRGGPRNIFGQVVENNFLTESGIAGDVQWGPVLAGQDIDSDGATNGEELQDPTGSWSQGQSQPGDASLVTKPWDANSKPQVQQPSQPQNPNIALSVTSLNFANVVKVGSRGEQSFKINNTGQGDLVVSAITVSDSAYKVAPSLVTVAPDSSADIGITFAPQTEGDHNAQLTISSNDPDQPEITVQLRATAQPAPQIPVLQGLLSTLDFGLVRLDSTRFQTLWIQNSGNAPLSVKLTVLDTLFMPSPNFVLTPDSLSVAPGDSAMVQIAFSPTDTVAYVHTLTVCSNDPDLPETTVDLRGTGFEFQGRLTIDLNPAFGNQGLSRVETAPGDTTTLEIFLDIVPFLPAFNLQIEWDEQGLTFLGSAMLLTSPSDPPILSRDTTGTVVDIKISIPIRETAQRDLLLGQILLSPQETLQDSTTVIAAGPDLQVLADGLETQPLQNAATIVRTASPLTGDFDNNGSVNFQDFLLFAGAFGKTDLKFDLDGDGTVTFADFLIFATAFGQTAASNGS